MYLIKSATLLSNWLNIHPMKNDPDAPLSVNLWNPKSGKREMRRWSYNAFNRMLRETARKAGIKKKGITAYILRHGAATRDARLGYNEALLFKKYGWAMGSELPRIYIPPCWQRPSGKDHAGLRRQGRGEAQAAMSKCPKCKLDNHPTNECCSRCGSVLDASRVVDLEQEGHSNECAAHSDAE